MFLFAYTGRANYDLATDEACAAFNRGDDAGALRLLISALADEPVAVEQEPAKKALITDMRAALAAVPK